VKANELDGDCRQGRSAPAIPADSISALGGYCVARARCPSGLSARTGRHTVTGYHHLSSSPSMAQPRATCSLDHATMDSIRLLATRRKARAPRKPAPGMDGVWFGEMAGRSYTGIPQYDRVCSGMEVDTGTCANACPTFIFAPVGSTCSVSINGGNGTLICRRVSGSQDSTNWQPVTCQM
jgi:hypothetical protein